MKDVKDIVVSGIVCLGLFYTAITYASNTEDRSIGVRELFSFNSSIDRPMTNEELEIYRSKVNKAKGLIVEIDRLVQKIDVLFIVIEDKFSNFDDHALCVTQEALERKIIELNNLEQSSTEEETKNIRMALDEHRETLKSFQVRTESVGCL